MAHIEKRIRNGKTTWRARWRGKDGKEHSKTFAKRGAAEDRLVAVGHSKATGLYVDPAHGRMRFSDWYERWWAATVNLRPSTRASEESRAHTYILNTFGDQRLADIDRLSIVEWVAELSASGRAPATVHKAYQLLSKIMRAATDSRLIAVSPCDRVPLPRIEAQEMRFCNPAEVAALAEVIDPRYRGFVELGAYGGLRLGEMLGLRRSRVDLLRRHVDVAEILVEVRGQITIGPPKTRAGRRSVPIPRVVAESLEGRLAGLVPDDLVFAAPLGGPVRASLFRRRVWLPAIRSAGLEPLRIHDLRHTAVAFWIAAGASPKEIARRAGHTSVSVVLDRYGHLLPGWRTESPTRSMRWPRSLPREARAWCRCGPSRILSRPHRGPNRCRGGNWLGDYSL